MNKWIFFRALPVHLESTEKFSVFVVVVALVLIRRNLTGLDEMIY